MKEYLEIGIKLGIGLLSLIFQMNLLGKGNLAPTSSLDQLQNFVLGGIIGGMIYNNNISILQFFLILIIWTFLVTLLKYLKENVSLLKKIIDGKPVVVIKNGKVLVENCAKKSISANDLMFKLRTMNIYDTSNIKKAFQEQNGQLTVILNGDEQVKFPIITNGFIDEESLENFRFDKEWLKEELKDKNINLPDVYLCEYIDNNLVFHLYENKTINKIKI